jgi:hypothetical protein
MDRNSRSDGRRKAKRWGKSSVPQTPKVTGELKVGAKVTIEYTMTATNVTVKADK